MGLLCDGDVLQLGPGAELRVEVLDDVGCRGFGGHCGVGLLMVGWWNEGGGIPGNGGGFENESEKVCEASGESEKV